MPRPTAAQLAYGSATVVLSTLAMLLLSGITSVVGVSVVGFVGLCLGVLVSVKAVPGRPAGAARAADSPASARNTAGSPSAADTRVPASLRR
ncbi:hypothetical protein OG875_20185 [Streptomyces sp. NBC_01498]|uniref:hypothetical protein n=1 Tax=Streptomyces sp. NBC_01498 TaxID=2975870 RepID=UPI002E7BE498|nr:hypothetical protein [Streptomyces sp. NBC_01498]WTL26676.1 hypothetical protein OG875_20185 [Streptomyces sp. NBC_01498]